MIKSTKVTLKFSNSTKKENIKFFITEYRSVVKQFIDLLWDQDNIPKLIPKTTTSQITTWLSARARQAAAKQASGIVRGTRKKQEKRYYVYNKLLNENRLKQANKLKRIIDRVKITKPDVKIISPELDSRFVTIDLNNQTTFDGWLTLTSLGKHLKVQIPFKKTKHFNKLYQKGKLKSGVRLSNKFLNFTFEIAKPEKRAEGQTIGLDIGILNSFTLSNGISSKPCNHGHTLQTINKKLARKRKGSRAFLKAQSHRKNYINWSLNQIDFNNIKTLKIENIKNLRYKSKYSRYLSHFTYTEIFNKLESLTDSNGVQLKKVNPTYTSQRCSNCGWVRSSNRKGKLFKCGACKFKCDADLNAAKNIAAGLRPLGPKARLKHQNQKGFYWNVSKGKFIVSPAQKVN